MPARRQGSGIAGIKILQLYKNVAMGPEKQEYTLNIVD
jgi:hypothetical protein